MVSIHFQCGRELAARGDGTWRYDYSAQWNIPPIYAGHESEQDSRILSRTVIQTLFHFQNYIKAKRFFVGEPVWQPYNRPCDDMECRKDYVKKLVHNEFSVN